MASINHVLNQETIKDLQKISDIVNECQKTADHTLAQLQLTAPPGPVRQMVELAQTQVNATNLAHGDHVQAWSTQQRQIEAGYQLQLDELGARIQVLERLLQAIIYTPQTGTPTSTWPSTCAPSECSSQLPSSIYYYVPASSSAADFEHTLPPASKLKAPSASRWKAPSASRWRDPSTFRWRAPTKQSASEEGGSSV